MEELSILILMVLVVLITIIIWNNNAEPYRKRGHSNHALLADFNQVHQGGKTFPYKFKLLPPKFRSNK